MGWAIKESLNRAIIIIMEIKINGLIQNFWFNSLQKFQKIYLTRLDGV